MKLSPLPCLALLLVAASSLAQAAETTPATGQDAYTTPRGSDARTYYREHRLRAYERSRATMSQGATCVTEAMVCWIDKPASDGDACSCEAPTRGVLHGVVGG